MERKFLILIKKKYQEKTLSRPHTNSETLKAFPLPSETKEGCSLSPLLFKVALKVSASMIRKVKEIKDIVFGKVQIKLIIRL